GWHRTDESVQRADRTRARTTAQKNRACCPRPRRKWWDATLDGLLKPRKDVDLHTFGVDLDKLDWLVEGQRITVDRRHLARSVFVVARVAEVVRIGHHLFQAGFPGCQCNAQEALVDVLTLVQGKISLRMEIAA